MFVTQAAAQDVENIRVALVLLALGIVFFWRIAVRILLAIVLVAIGAGALVLLQGAAQVIREKPAGRQCHQPG
jgi:hypothetical protein